MKTINLQAIPEMSWDSPSGKYGGFGKQISEALGRERESMDLTKRHPFDVELSRLAPGKTDCPFHAHSAQWEMYVVVSGTARVRDEAGFTDVGPGDSFIFAPGQAHQITNTGTGDFIFYIIADNPVGEVCYYPDSQKWSVPLPKRSILKGHPVDYYEGEEG